MIIREARDADEEGIRLLFRTSFFSELSHEAWQWKYRRSHLGSSAVVAEDDGLIIAHYGGFRMRFYLRGRHHDVFQGCDVMTHPAYRARVFAKKGIIVRAAEAFYEANPMEFIFGFPSERHARLMTLQLRWERHAFITVMQKTLGDGLSAAGAAWRPVHGWEHLSSIGIDRLWARNRETRELTIDKDSPYLFWRYRDNPRGGYELVVFRDFFRRNRGYAVVKKSETGMLVLEFCVPDERDVAKALTSLTRLAAADAATAVTFWMHPSDRDFGALRSAGYMQQQGIPYTLRLFDGAGIDARVFFDSYQYSMGDYDAA